MVGLGIVWRWRPRSSCALASLCARNLPLYLIQALLNLLFFFRFGGSMTVLATEELRKLHLGGGASSARSARLVPRKARAFQSSRSCFISSYSRPKTYQPR